MIVAVRGRAWDLRQDTGGGRKDHAMMRNQAVDAMTLQAASEHFLAQAALADGTRRTYRVTMRAIIEFLGSEQPVASVRRQDVERFLTEGCAGLARATRNARLAALASLTRHLAQAGVLETDPLAGIVRHRLEPREPSALSDAAVEKLFADASVRVRDRAMWRVIRDSGARPTRVLLLNIEDLTSDHRAARSQSPSPDLAWGPHAASLVTETVDDRTLGPVFVSSRRASESTLERDRCVASGRTRLSYRRAAEVFSRASGGGSLEQLRQRLPSSAGVTAFSARGERP